MIEHSARMPKPERDRFGHWLSGFTDGEGCFHLKTTGDKKGFHYPVAHFYIQLRWDDRPVLLDVQRYFGGIGRFDESWDRIGHKKIRYGIGVFSELAGVVVPHFDEYPLRAKKARDYRIWREAVMLCREVQCRRLQFAGRGEKGHVTGTIPKWQPGELDRFRGLIRDLRALKPYDPSRAPA